MSQNHGFDMSHPQTLTDATSDDVARKDDAGERACAEGGASFQRSRRPLKVLRLVSVNLN